MTELFAKVERVLASVTALLLFTLNEVRMFHALPREAQPEAGQTYPGWLALFGGSERVFMSGADLAIRWSLAALVVGLCAWALMDTFKKRPATE